MVLSDMGASWEVWTNQPTTNDTGWDTTRLVVAKDFRNSAVGGLDIVKDWPIGRRLAGNFWCTGATPERVAANIWTCEVRGKGLAANRPWKINISGAVEQQESPVPIPVPGLGGLWRTQVMESNPRLEVEYISFNRPQTQLIGTAGVPPYAMAVRSSVWSYLLNPLVHFPNGWVLIDMPAEKLAGAEVWLVKEVWQYVHRFSV